MSDLFVRDARLLDGRGADVTVRGGTIAEVVPAGSGRPPESGRVVDARGGLLLPGLHDHHLHLFATVAAVASVKCGPLDARTGDGLARRLRTASSVAAKGDWIRAVGWHESVGGMLDRDVLDRWVGGVPVRVQHASGALWVVNSAGLVVLGVDAAPSPDGVERDAAGRATGRLWRLDAWMRERLGPGPPPDLAPLGAQLAAAGVTGLTDATPELNAETAQALVEALATGALPQRLHMLGVDRLPSGLEPSTRGRVSVGPRKVVLHDHDLPTLPQLVAWLRAARRTSPTRQRPVAVHCVTREALILLVVALDEVGAVPGDRIEHASLVPTEILPRLRRLGVTVVTQPGLVAERGDRYRSEVDPADLNGLYRHASLLAAGIPVGLSTDAPHTVVDPWAVIRAATDRRTRAGHVVGDRERVDTAAALAGLITPADSPGGAPRRVAAGAVADLCLLVEPTVTSTPTIRLTVAAGRVVHDLQ